MLPVFPSIITSTDVRVGKNEDGVGDEKVEELGKEEEEGGPMEIRSREQRRVQGQERVRREEEGR